MKVTIQKKALAELAESAAAVADGKAMIVLGEVVLRAEDGRLHASATDAYTSLRSSAACEVGDGGTCAVGAKALRDVVSKLPDGEVKLAFDPAKYRLTVKAARSSYQLATNSPDDQPKIPSPSTPWTTVPSASLRRVIDATLCAMSSDTTRAHMHAVSMHIADGSLLAVTTDGHRLHLCEMPHEGGITDILVPPKGVGLLRSFGEGDVELSVDGPHIFARQGERTFGVKLVEERFAPYTKVIPAPTPTPTRVQREVLSDAVKRLAGVCDAVKFRIEPNTIRLEATTMDGGKTGCEEVPADTGPNESEWIGASSRYLLDAITKSNAADLELHTRGGLDPIVVRCEGYVAVVMPQRV